VSTTSVGFDYKVSLLVLYDFEGRFLLQYRTSDARIMPDYWAFFGGGHKDGETPDEALFREALEELDYIPKCPIFVLEQKFAEEFTEDKTSGHLYVYIEPYYGDKSALKLQEGQGWGWFSMSETKDLKMAERDREILRKITLYMEKADGRTT
jgi:8-oxo-dGTP pyrophosphatase MutT (NUDIX family)